MALWQQSLGNDQDKLFNQAKFSIWTLWNSRYDFLKVIFFPFPIKVNGLAQCLGTPKSSCKPKTLATKAVNSGASGAPNLDLNAQDSNPWVVWQQGRTCRLSEGKSGQRLNAVTRHCKADLRENHLQLRSLNTPPVPRICCKTELPSLKTHRHWAKNEKQPYLQVGYQIWQSVHFHCAMPRWHLAKRKKKYSAKTSAYTPLLVINKTLNFKWEL